MARPPRSSTSATRPRSSGSPRASSRRSVVPRPLRGFAAQAGQFSAIPTERSEWRDPINFRSSPHHPFPSRRDWTWMPRFARRLRRDDHEIDPSLPLSLIAASRSNLGATRNLRCRSDFVRRAPAGECPKSAWRLRRLRTPSARCLFRASAAARDPPQSGARKRTPSHDLSRPSRRSPSLQRPPTVAVVTRIRAGVFFAISSVGRNDGVLIESDRSSASPQ
jgi:hypothetical protein